MFYNVINSIEPVVTIVGSISTVIVFIQFLMKLHAYLKDK